MIFKTAALLVISLALPASATWPPSPATQAGESKKYKVFYGEPGKHPLGTVLCDEGEKATIRWNSVEHRATHTIVDGGSIYFKVENGQPISIWFTGRSPGKYKLTANEVS
ncbi:hypothetical protein PoMZ_03816 [Pyricularia oryzae]|uniref:Uncharacterized protein n=1 Tax=Pyricularia oryzae TaxID=318829 RepID=A0A4P7N864_PYROR|nr:hypothetical protein PoMZ_03816 [Pyricularia oryzae]